MRFALRQLVAATALMAIICVVVAPYFLPSKSYSIGRGGGVAGGEHAVVRSCFSVRGYNIPTIVCGEAESGFSGLGLGQLPFALVLLNEPSESLSINSRAFFREGDKGPSSTTSIVLGDGKKVVVVYKLLIQFWNEPLSVVEVFEVDGVEYDLGAGRLFTVDENGGVAQLELLKINRSVLPNCNEGDKTEFAAFLDWWKTVRQTFAIDDW